MPLLMQRGWHWKCCLCGGRDAYGVPLLVDLLTYTRAVEDGLAAAACDALTALTAGNPANKAAVRDAWALPLLIRLLAPPVSPGSYLCKK